MKKILVLLGLYGMAFAVLAHGIVLDNKTNYPEKGKIVLQWASSAEALQRINRLSIHEMEQSSLIMLSKKGRIMLTPPNHAQYFRILAWSTGKQEPDLLTNWVNIISDKMYTVNQDHLVSAVLMSGAGC